LGTGLFKKKKGKPPPLLKKSIVKIIIEANINDCLDSPRLPFTHRLTPNFEDGILGNLSSYCIVAKHQKYANNGKLPPPI